MHTIVKLLGGCIQIIGGIYPPNPLGFGTPGRLIYRAIYTVLLYEHNYAASRIFALTAEKVMRCFKLVKTLHQTAHHSIFTHKLQFFSRDNLQIAEIGNPAI